MHRAETIGLRVLVAAALPVVLTVNALPAAEVTVRDGAQVAARLIGPALSGPAERIVPGTLNCYLSAWYGWKIPVATSAEVEGLNILAGNATNNPVIQQLTGAGLQLNLADAGAEGFRLLTHEQGGRRYLIIAANSAAGLKHGCQELVFFRMPSTASRSWINWPMDVQMKPQFGHRAIYMLPCWSAYDSIASWQRVLRFNSEITLNRNWFWLAGFPLIEKYGGEYKGSDLADPEKVRGLVDLCRSEAMKFYIGGGWFTFHHEKHAAGSIERGAAYYLDMLKLLPGAEGIYLEPPGEGYEVTEEVWRARTTAMHNMMKTIWRCREDFEFALAIGMFNAAPYREMVHNIDDERVFWWWCWGDPIRDNALAQHPLILRWHTVVQMSNYHGSIQPPGPQEVALTGFSSSYDPGMGYGNPWNGWGKMGVDKPRDFDPYTMPYFSHQYWFRERCWNVNLTETQFAQRLAARLFDADVPAQAIQHYLDLARFCPNPGAASESQLATIKAFVDARWATGSSRNRDTLSRMREALEGIAKVRAAAAAAPAEK